MDERIKVGAKVWVRRTRNRQANEKDQECTITKIGKKHFTAEWSSGISRQFSIENMTHEERDLGVVSIATLDRQTWIDQEEQERLCAAIAWRFDWSRRDKITLDQARRIYEILEEEK